MIKEVENVTSLREQREALKTLADVFPDFETESSGVYDNRRLLDMLGAGLVIDLLGSFHEEMEQDSFAFRMALSELADMSLTSNARYSAGDKDAVGRLFLWETRQYFGANERGRMYLEMRKGERQHYDNLVGGIVSYLYWTEEAEHLFRLQGTEGFRFPSEDILQ